MNQCFSYNTVTPSRAAFLLSSSSHPSGIAPFQSAFVLALVGTKILLGFGTRLNYDGEDGGDSMGASPLSMPDGA
jgi:hypothetical protein